MMRRTMVVLALLIAFVQGTMLGQEVECGPDWVSGTGTAAPYWLEVDGEVRSSHTNMVTALRALKDTLLVRPEATVYVRASFRGRWLGACGGGVDTTVHQDTLPPVQDTIPFEVCPADWTCTPPDTTTAPPPQPTGVSLGGYTTSQQNGLQLTWDAGPPGVDSILVYGGREDGDSDDWSAWLPADATSYRRHLGYETVTPIWACVEFGGEPGCADMDWPPMPAYRVVIEGGLRPAVGDSIRLLLERSAMLGGSWADSTAPFPDSVVFRVNGDRHRERGHPYQYPGDSPGVYVVPAADSIRAEWEVFGPEPFSGRFAFPIIQETGAGDTPPDDGPINLREEAEYWAENQFSDPTGYRLYYIGTTSTFAGNDPQSQFALGNDRGVMWGHRNTAQVIQQAEDLWPPEGHCLIRGDPVKEYPPVDDTAEPKTPWCQ